MPQCLACGDYYPSQRGLQLHYSYRPECIGIIDANEQDDSSGDNNSTDEMSLAQPAQDDDNEEDMDFGLVVDDDSSVGDALESDEFPVGEVFNPIDESDDEDKSLSSQSTIDHRHYRHDSLFGFVYVNCWM